MSNSRSKKETNSLSVVLSTAVDGVILINDKGAIDVFNPACEKLFGYKASEVLGKNVNTLMPNPYQKEHDGYLNNYLRTGERKIIGIGREVMGQRKDGSHFPMELSVGEAEQDGKRLFVGIIRDITERKEAEKELRESGERLLAVVDTAVDGVIIIDAKARITNFNPACERLFGYKAAEVINHNVKMLMPGPYRDEHDSYMSNYQETGERKIIGIGREVLGQRKDGSTFPMELSVGEAQQYGEPVFVGIIRDITERKEAEKELRESGERLLAVVDTAVDGVIIIDSKACITNFNPACERLFGYRAAEVINHNVKMLMPGPYRDEHDGYMSNYQETGERKIIGIGREVMGQRKNGTTFPMELSVGEAQQNGEPVFVGIIRDITERKASEQAINRSVKELAAFAYSVAHDLKAPLRAIEGFSSAILEDYEHEVNATIQEYLNHISDGASRMGVMIDDLLEYSRIGRDQATFSSLSPKLIIETVIKSVANVVKEKNAQIKFKGKWQKIDLHKPTMTSLFQNLITNALKFTYPNRRPEILFECKPNRDMVEISVSDNGIGIPDDCYEKVFQIFHRLHDRTVYPGTGIGLAVVQKVVDFHHGSISVKSQEGKGTSFRIRIPVKQVKPM